MNKILSLYVELLTKCNADCLYCYNKNIMRYDFALPCNIVKKIISEAKENNLDFISLSGGEPLLYQDISQVLEYANSMKQKILIITNGTIIDEGLLKQLALYNPSLQLTLDGHTKEEHDHTRGKGNYERLQKFIDKLIALNYRGNIIFRINISKKNFCNLDKICEKAASLGAGAISISFVNRIGKGKECDIAFEQMDYEVVKEINDFVSTWTKTDILFSGETPDYGCPFCKEKDVEFGLRIRPDGMVFPCQLFDSEQFSIGDIYINSLNEIVNSEKASKLLELVRNRKLFIEKCRKCALAAMCNAGCPALAYNNNDNFFSVYNECDFRKKIIRERIKTNSL